MRAAFKSLFATLNHATAYRAAVMADSPVAYWRLGESSGIAVADETGNHPGTYLNSPTLGAAGPMMGEKAVSWNGTDQRATVADAAALRPTGVITVEAWIKFGTAQTNRGIVGKYSTAAAQRAWALYTANDGSGRKVQFTIQTAGGTFNPATVAISTNNLDDNIWHHVVGVFAPTSTLRLYVDGVANANASAIPATIFASTVPLEIAAHNQATNFFGGQMSEVAVYPSALSAGRIAAHYAAAGY